MIALDTCVLARLLVGDDPAQQAAAVVLMETQDTAISWSVLIELAWVLERGMSLPRPKVVAALAALTQIDRMTLPSAEMFDWCVARYAAGADFADMVHLASTLSGSTGFATFDRKLPRQAGETTPIAVQIVR